MLRLILFSMATLSIVVPAAVVQADVSIHVEDFENDQGGPDFDPLFNHSITLLDDQGLNWFLDGGGQFGRPDDWFLGLYHAHDTVTFNLPPNQVVVTASIEVVAAWNLSFGFVGETGEVVHDGFFNGVFEVSSQEIGNVSSIWFQNHAYFNDITIRVAQVPEPKVAYGLIVVGLLCGVVRIRHHARLSRFM